MKGLVEEDIVKLTEKQGKRFDDWCERIRDTCEEYLWSDDEPWSDDEDNDDDIFGGYNSDYDYFYGYDSDYSD